MMSSEQEKISLEVENAIIKNDLDTLKQLLVNIPDCSSIRDENGDTPLHLSVILQKQEIFNYLLSLEKIGLEAQNKTGQTPLILSLTDQFDVFAIEYFAEELIKKGADTNVVSGLNNTVLHLALQYHFFNVARLAIERGADLDARNDVGCTPFHTLFHVKTDPEGLIEGIGMMIYYGADATIYDNYGNIPFELAVIYDPYITAAQESLLYYTFDSHSNYRMSVEVLFELLLTKSPLFYQIIDYVSEVVFVKGVSLSPFLLFRIDLGFLKVLIEKFDYVVKKILSCPSDYFNWFRFKGESVQNWELLLQSHLASDVVEFIGRFKISWLVKRLEEDQVPPKISKDFIFFLLTYGLDVSEIGIQAVYKKYGYCDLFKTLLHMDIKTNKLMNTDILPKLIYDVNLDLETFLKDPHNYSINAIEELLNYYAHPKLRQFCNQIGVRKLINRVNDLPHVPLLVELARNASRKYLVKKYKITCPKEFFTLIKHLPISRIHEKILSFESKLYL